MSPEKNKGPYNKQMEELEKEFPGLKDKMRDGRKPTPGTDPEQIDREISERLAEARRDTKHPGERLEELEKEAEDKLKNDQAQ